MMLANRQAGSISQHNAVDQLDLRPAAALPDGSVWPSERTHLFEMRGLAVGDPLDIATRQTCSMPGRYDALRYRLDATYYRSKTGRLATAERVFPRGGYEGILLVRGGYATAYPTHEEAAVGEVLKKARLQEKAAGSMSYPCPPGAASPRWLALGTQRRTYG